MLMVLVSGFICGSNNLSFGEFCLANYRVAAYSYIRFGSTGGGVELQGVAGFYLEGRGT